MVPMTPQNHYEPSPARSKMQPGDIFLAPGVFGLKLKNLPGSGNTLELGN
jgi:hypothetical protein